MVGGWAGNDGSAGAVGVELGVVVIGGVFVFDFGDAAEGGDAEVGFFWFFGWWGRWWRDVRSSFVKMGEVALAILFPAPWVELFVITHDRHIARDGTEDDGDQEDDGEDALNDDDDDSDDSSRDAWQGEAVVERCGKSKSRDLAEAEGVDHDRVESCTFEGFEDVESHQGDKLDHEKAKDLRHHLSSSTSIKTCADEFIDKPYGEKPPSCSPEARGQPAEFLDVFLVLMHLQTLGVFADVIDTQKRY